MIVEFATHPRSTRDDDPIAHRDRLERSRVLFDSDCTGRIRRFPYLAVRPVSRISTKRTMATYDSSYGRSVGSRSNDMSKCGGCRVNNERAHRTNSVRRRHPGMGASNRLCHPGRGGWRSPTDIVDAKAPHLQRSQIVSRSPRVRTPPTGPVRTTSPTNTASLDDWHRRGHPLDGFNRPEVRSCSIAWRLRTVMRPRVGRAGSACRVIGHPWAITRRATWSQFGHTFLGTGCQRPAGIGRSDHRGPQISGVSGDIGSSRHLSHTRFVGVRVPPRAPHETSQVLPMARAVRGFSGTDSLTV